MPIYEYKCAEGHITEKLISIRMSEEDQLIQECTLCGRPAGKIDISKGSFALKGNWFKTKGEY